MSTKKEKIVVTKDHIDFLDGELKIVADSREYHANAPKFHKEFEIKYCYEGCFNVIVNSEVYTMNPGDIVIINPYEIHENPKDYMGCGKYYLLVFDLDIFDKGYIGREFYSQRKKFQHLIQNNTVIQELIVLIVKELKEKKLHYQDIVSHLVEYLLVLLLREDRKENNEQVVGEDFNEIKKISPSLELIHMNYMEKLTLEDLAKACHMNKYNYCRNFKKIMRLSPIQYLNVYRIGIAEMLLKNTMDSCEEIGYRCGFNDIGYFIRIYKKLRGVSPSKTRKK